MGGIALVQIDLLTTITIWYSPYGQNVLVFAAVKYLPEVNDNQTLGVVQ